MARRDWFREFVRTQGEAPLAVVGPARVGDDVIETAARIRHAIGFDVAERRLMGSWDEALRRFIQLVDERGILVMVSGVVGSNTRRRLNPQEFRGFALADDRAPLIFLNGADSKAAQMFTLAHELAHVWLGQSGVSNATAFAAFGQSDRELVQPGSGGIPGADDRVAPCVGCCSDAT